MTTTRSALFALLFGLAAAQSPLAPAAAEAGPTIVTVAGAVTKTNRGAFDESADVFLKFHEKTFEKAHAFDRAALKALPQISITAKAAAWPAAVAASGPALRDVLAAAGVSEDATITLFALDGYGVELSGADRAATEWVLAIEADGAPLGLGGHGPAWLLQDTGADAATEEQEGKWVWSVFYIEAQ